MRDRLWKTTDKLAAELVVYHRETADPNLIEKTIHHIVIQESNLEELREWLDAQMRFAGYFERSRQSVPQLATTLALVNALAGKVKTMDELGEALGWTARLMKYYQQYRAEALETAGRQSLMVSDPPPLEPVKRPKPAAKSEPDQRPSSEESRKFAEDFLKWMQSQQSDQDEE